MLHPIYRRNVWAFSLEIMQRDGITPANLSDKTVGVIVKKNKSDHDSQTVLPRLNFENSNTNLISIQYTPDETAAVLTGTYWVAVKIFSEDDNNEEVFLEQVQVKEGGFQNE